MVCLSVDFLLLFDLSASHRMTLPHDKKGQNASESANSIDPCQLARYGQDDLQNQFSASQRMTVYLMIKRGKMHQDQQTVLINVSLQSMGELTYGMSFSRLFTIIQFFCKSKNDCVPHDSPSCSTK